MKLTIVDYGTGNVKSLMSALGLYADVELSNRIEILASSDCIVLPGVGSFGQAASVLQDNGLVEFLQAWALKQQKIMGICLGMQLFFSSSEESPGASGLGLFPEKVSLMKPKTGKVPNIGWRRTIPFDLERESEDFYYCHSYVVPYNEFYTTAICWYGEQLFCAELNVSNRLFGFQYHPEKSGPAGLEVLKKTIGLMEGVK